MKIKKILNSNLLYIFLILLAIAFVLAKSNSVEHSSYSLSLETITGILKDVRVYENRIIMTINDNEDLICNYYVEKQDTAIEDYPLGSKVTANVKLKEPINNTIPNTFNYKKYLNNKGIYYTCTISSYTLDSEDISFIYRIKNAVIKRIETFKIKDYLYTMIMGNKTLLDDETLESYQKNGVTHLFAISGMHIGLFAAFIIWILKKFRLKENVSYLVAIIFIWFYAFLVGFSSSVLRAGMFFSILTIDKIFKLDLDKLKALILAGFILVMANYKIVYDIGFQYSFLTTFGLIYSKEVLKKHKIIGTSLVAFLYSLPLTINNFYSINFLSIFINIIFVPYVSIIVYPLCLISFIIRPTENLTKIFIYIMEFISKNIMKLGFFIFVIPKMNLILVFIYYLLLSVFLKKKFYKTSTILILLVMLNKLKPFVDPANYVEFLDVGQGDSILIRTAYNREVILIDTGGNSYNTSYHVANNTITYLHSLGIEKISTMILSHGDYDHLGDAMYIIENMQVDKIIINKGEMNSLEMDLFSTEIPISHSYVGKLDIEFLNEDIYDDENANSIVITLNLSGVKFLFMGDATKEVEKAILSANPTLQTDVIKLGHHGSKTSSDSAFLKAIEAKMAIISSGRGNIYGHPHEETINTLDELGIEYLNTQYAGSIIYKMYRGVTIFTFPP